MLTALIVSNVVQWIALLLMGGLIVVLLRQIGLLHERIGPVGALTLPGGPAVGDMAPTFELECLNRGMVRLGGPNKVGQSTLLFFLSPTCPVCKTLLPVLKSIAAEQGTRLRLVLASDGDEDAQRRMIAREKLEGYPLVLSTPLGMSYQVSKLPHAVLIDADGRVAAKGLVNNREHLESLFEAHDRSVASIQEYLAGHPRMQAGSQR